MSKTKPALLQGLAWLNYKLTSHITSSVASVETSIIQVKATFRHLANVQLGLVSFWLALRAGVLRRAFSLSVRPTSVLAVKGSAWAAFCFRRLGCGTEQTTSKCTNTNYALPISFNIRAVWPNRSLNRTFCGGPRLGFISFSPKPSPPQNAG